MESNKPSIGSLFATIVGDFSTLVRKEVELAKAELKEDLKEVAKGAGLIAAAAVLALFAFGALTFALVYLLDIWLPLALSFLIVALIYLGVAALIGLLAKKEFDKVNGLELTVETVKEDVKWLSPEN